MEGVSSDQSIIFSPILMVNCVSTSAAPTIRLAEPFFSGMERKYAYHANKETGLVPTAKLAVDGLVPCSIAYARPDSQNFAPRSRERCSISVGGAMPSPLGGFNISMLTWPAGKKINVSSAVSSRQVRPPLTGFKAPCATHRYTHHTPPRPSS